MLYIMHSSKYCNGETEMTVHACLHCNDIAYMMPQLCAVDYSATSK